jgi:hypothetical protein
MGELQTQVSEPEIEKLDIDVSVTKLSALMVQAFEKGNPDRMRMIAQYAHRLSGQYEELYFDTVALL